jgi:hypothetical protein
MVHAAGRNQTPTSLGVNEQHFYWAKETASLEWRALYFRSPAILQVIGHKGKRKSDTAILVLSSSNSKLHLPPKLY